MRFFTTHEVGQLLQVNPSTVSKWVDRGLLPAHRTPGGHRRVRSDDLKSFVELHQMPMPAELGPPSVRLLVVDDEKPVIDTLRRVLRPFADRIQLVGTTSGIEALLRVGAERPNGVLIDLNMPELDGFEVCRQIRARKELSSVRLITMTAQHSAEREAEAKRAGAIACLPKPVDPEKLLPLLGVSTLQRKSARD